MGSDNEKRYTLSVFCGEGNFKSLDIWCDTIDAEMMQALFKRFNKTKGKGEQILVTLEEKKE